MTTVSEIQQRRRRRSDADRSAAAVLDAAVRVLGQRPAASVEEIAAAAGVSRQTAYAHYPSRQALLAAVLDRITAETVAALDAADLDSGTATEALLRWLDASWQAFDRYPLLLDASITAGEAEESARQHAPIADRFRRLVARGRRTGEFDRTLSPAWLVTATIALGHAAGAEVSAGRMTSAQAHRALRESILRLYGATESTAASSRRR